MANQSFLEKYKILIISVIICVLILVIWPTSVPNPLTGRFIEPRQNIVSHGKALIYETGPDSGADKSYSIMNYGETTIDVFIKSRDSSQAAKIYLPETGWLNIPQNSSGEILCIAEELAPNSTISGYKLDILSTDSRILQSISLISYGANETNSCKAVGEYIAMP